MAPSTDAATSGPATKTQSYTSSRRSLSGLDPGHGYPHGHLGHLTPDEEAAFAAFKTHLAEQSLYRPASPPSPPSHDDTVLLRFLRARRWSVPDAAAQFRDTEAWRAAVHIDVLYDTIDVDAYEQSRRLYPQWTGRRDRRGIPVYLFEIRHLDGKTIAAYEKSVATTYSKVPPPQGRDAKDKDKGASSKMVRLFALYENLTRFAQPLCTQLTDRDHPETPITLSTNIVDVSGVSLRQFWNLKGHMQVASQLATAHYPETLDRIFIIGAPAFFSTVWGWVKRWFDPVTVSKIFILSQADVLPTLTAFIDPANIPLQYGGQLDFGWGDAPHLDPRIRELAAWEEGLTDFPQGPLYWVPIDDGKRLACLARGSVDKKERNQRVCTIPVAFPASATAADAPSSQEKEEPAANGHAVEPAAAAAAAGVIAAEEPAGAEDAPAATVDGVAKAAAIPEVASGETGPSADAPATAEAITEVQGVQNLSLREADDKIADGDVAAVSEKAAETETVPNGKPVTGS